MEQKKRINLKAISFVLYPSASDPRMNVKAVCNCNCNGNLFTHEALRSVRAFKINFEVLVFEEKGKPQYPEKNLSE